MVRKRVLGVLFVCAVFAAVIIAGTEIPQFGRDTVLVWNIKNQDYTAEFVVRIAEFAPDRFVEWEDTNNQGMVFMPSRDVLEAKDFVGTHLFKSGVEAQSKGATTLWLSQKIYRELKEKKKAKCGLDGAPASLSYLGDAELAVEVNRSSMVLPVIRIADDRGAERWFLDQEDNPLMLKHQVRHFSQTLSSITTDRRNTLRWIKGKKLAK